MSPDRRRTVIAEWLTHVQGELTQEALARDISEATGWNLDRTRLGRYQNGKLAVGREVIAHLADYAKARGIPGPDFSPPAQVEVIDPVAAAIDRQTAVLERLVLALGHMAEAQAGTSGELSKVLGALLPEAAISRLLQASQNEIEPR